VIGTRPEAIKLSPVAHALASRGLRPSLIVTGQHEGLEPAGFGLGGFPAINLRLAGEEDPHVHVRKVAAAVRTVLVSAPHLLMVQGDTSSALGAALGAFAAGIPVGHVEAGLRTYDNALPWPEEEYRTAIDAKAALLFAPTELAAANLVGERVGGAVHVTGNTGIDALLAVERALPAPRARDRGTPRILVTCHRRESWGQGLQAIAAALADLARDRAALIEVILHPNPRVSRTMRALLGQVPGISLAEPCSHSELVAKMRDSDLILSDSGGIQEEAPALGVPLLVLREKTERPEGLVTGNMRLVGTSTEAIAAEARRLLSSPLAQAAMSRRAFPYGDGYAAGRIADIVCEWLAPRMTEPPELLARRGSAFHTWREC
jgi:UDP-N-acetylglucosamine 2-epimerase (non-hydrolysing)